MSQPLSSRKFSRRDFIKLGGGVLAAAAGSYMLPRIVSAANQAITAAKPAAAPIVDAEGFHYHLAATDGWIYLPGSVDGDFNGRPMSFHPDPAAPDPFNTYAFGFRDVTNLADSDGLTKDQKIRAQANKVQASAPLLFAKAGQKLRITLTNLGLLQRPDLTDGHSIHFHGFPNAIPVYDGVPELSIGVPIGESFTYYYQPHDAGTYMYHCHFEDVEHVSMGMTGVIYVRPQSNDKWVYEDGGATAFDREFSLILAEVWAQERWRDAHIQENDWSDYEPNYWTINGRVYPDTVAPAGGGFDNSTGDLIAPAGRPDLQYQPISTRITCNSGDKVLLRVANLGYQQQTMKVDGLNLRIVGKDAKPLNVPGKSDLSYETDSVYVGPGDSYDIIFTAPSVGGETTYYFYNTNMARLNNPGTAGLGGQMTEIHVFPANTLPPQSGPNT